MKYVILLCAVLVGCSDKTTSMLLVDPATGCQYAITKYDTVTTVKPLTDSKGKQRCEVPNAQL